LTLIDQGLGLKPTLTGVVTDNVTGWGKSGAKAQPLPVYGKADGNGKYRTEAQL
jgi:hypothetical protein